MSDKPGHARQRHGAEPLVRPEGLRVFDPLPGVPATRGDCAGGERPCRHTACRSHLWREDGSDRPGRRVAGRAPATTLRPVWLEVEPGPSCALDVADAVAAHGEGMTAEKLAAVLGLRPSRLRQLVADALEKLRTARAAAELDDRDAGSTAPMWRSR